jgi:hypothetical protein
MTGLLALSWVAVGCQSGPASSGPGQASVGSGMESVALGTPPAAPTMALAVGLPPALQAESADAVGQLLGDMAGPTCQDEVAAVGAQAPLSPEARPPRAGEPRLWVVELPAQGEAVVDVGAISRGEPSDHRFTLENAGSAELRLDRFSASCGCTRVEAEAKVLAPGERTTLHVTYDPRDTEEPSDRIRKMVRIRSNDPQRPLAEFAMTGTLAP